MDKPVPGNDYSQGQMMGMLVIIQMLENAKDAGIVVPAENLEIIKRVAVESLSDYLEKPEEDVILLVDKQLRDLP